MVEGKEKNDGVRIGFKEVYGVVLDNRNLIDLFIMTVIKLKTDVNYYHARMVGNTNSVPDQIEIGKFNIHAYVLTMSVRLFINWYARNNSKDIIEFMYRFIESKKEELYFTKFNVKLEARDKNVADDIIDALCVKYYQELIYGLHLYFTKHHKIISIKAEHETASYLFGIREMNIFELQEANNGIMPINSIK